MLNLKKTLPAVIAALSVSWAATPALASGGGGGGAQPPVVSVLPTTPPAPNILIRESFGLADGLRPAGGKGLLKPYPIHTSLGGFWVEYPGNKNNAWITSNGNQTWRFAAIGGYLDPYELPSPLQATEFGQGAIISDWFDPVTQYPTALLPFKQPAQPYVVSMEGYPSVVAGAYIAIGLTGSGATLSNFTSVGQVWLSLRKEQAMVNGPLVYEWRLTGQAGPLLATGVVDDVTWNRMEIHYDPVAQNVSASINGLALGSHHLAITPSFVGFEGVGILDNFVISLEP